MASTVNTAGMNVLTTARYAVRLNAVLLAVLRLKKKGNPHADHPFLARLQKDAIKYR